MVSLSSIEQLRLADIDRRIRTFRATSKDAKVAASPFVLACLSDQAFLLELYRTTKRALDHLANSSTATALATPRPAATATTLPDPPRHADTDAGWRQGLAAAAAEVARSLNRAMRDGLSPYAARDAAVAAVLALTRGLPTAPTPRPPTEPPPFTVENP